MIDKIFDDEVVLTHRTVINHLSENGGGGLFYSKI